jgi:GNAT superfamily N-acetyltransferase
MPDVLIRQYEKRDRDSVFRLVADTAFFGEPLERFLDDRRLFCDGMYAYYTDVEPEHAWVAVAGGQVVGVLVASVDSSGHRRRWIARILPRMALRLLTGRYTLGARTWRHSLRTIKARLAGGEKIDLRKYPAHLHLNVHAAWRGQGIGRRLLEASLDQLRSLRVPGVHLNTTDLNTAAGNLYRSAGFRIAHAQPASQWSGLVSRDVMKVCYVRELP